MSIILESTYNIPFKTASYNMGKTVIKPMNIGRILGFNQIRANIIIAIVGTDFKNFNIGIIKLNTNFEKLDKRPNIIAKDREIKKPVRLLNKVIFIVRKKYSSLTIFIKFVKVLLIVRINTSLSISFDNKIQRHIIRSRGNIEYFLSFKIKLFIWKLISYKLRCKI